MTTPKARIAPSFTAFFALCALLAVAVSACQATTKNASAPTEDTFWKAVRTSAAEPDGPAKRTSGTLTRQELTPFLQAGPSQVLAQVPVTPILDGDSLVGYRINAFFENDPRFAAVDLVPGDIITAVNGASLGTPDAFFAVWEALETAPRLQIDVIRGQTMRTLHWEIIDQAPADPVHASSANTP